MRPIPRLALLALALLPMLGCSEGSRPPGRAVRIEGSGPVFNIAVSPDGGHLACSSDRGSRDGTRNIWVMNADGSKQRQLTFSSGKRMNMNPAWRAGASSVFFLHKADGALLIRRIEFGPWGLQQYPWR